MIMACRRMIMAYFSFDSNILLGQLQHVIWMIMACYSDDYGMLLVCLWHVLRMIIACFSDACGMFSKFHKIKILKTIKSFGHVVGHTCHPSLCLCLLGGWGALITIFQKMWPLFLFTFLYSRVKPVLVLWRARCACAQNAVMLWACDCPHCPSAALSVSLFVDGPICSGKHLAMEIRRSCR